MIEDKCNHKWKKFTGLHIINGGDLRQSTFKCEKCQDEMMSSEVFQLEALENQNETLKHIKGFQSHIAIITVVISIFAILISLVALLNPILRIIK